MDNNSGKELKHCQICERDIKVVFIMGRVDGKLTKDWVMAHHGYQRPGDGYQTASCFGAKFRPYEEACDALPLAIETAKDWIAQRSQWLADFVKNPPETIMESYVSMRHPAKIFDRPEGFDSKVCLDPETQGYGGSYDLMSYEYEYQHKYKNVNRDIKYAQKDVNRMEKRLAAWVAPK